MSPAHPSRNVCQYMKNSKALTLLIFLELEWQYLQVRTPVQNWSQELKFIVITQHGSSLLTCRANVSAMRLQGIILLVPLILLFASYPSFGWIKNVRKNIHVLWLKKYEKVLRLIIINNHDFHKKKKKSQILICQHAIPEQQLPIAAVCI